MGGVESRTAPPGTAPPSSATWTTRSPPRPRHRTGAARAPGPGEKTERPDTPQVADKSAERVEKLETELADTKSELAETKAELSDAKAERSKLIDTVSRQADKIDRHDAKAERHDARVEKLESDNDKLRSENDRLKARVAELEKNDKTAGVQGHHEADGAEQDGKADEPKRGRRHLPSGKAAGVLTASVGAWDAIGTTSHALTSGEGTIIGAGATLVGAGYLWAKSKWEKKHDD